MSGTDPGPVTRAGCILQLQSESWCLSYLHLQQQQACKLNPHSCAAVLEAHQALVTAPEHLLLTATVLWAAKADPLLCLVFFTIRDPKLTGMSLTVVELLSTICLRQILQ